MAKTGTKRLGHVRGIKLAGDEAWILSAPVGGLIDGRGGNEAADGAAEGQTGGE